MVQTRSTETGLIDLHTHTNESDGSYTPAQLVEAALELKLEALAITDHDTFAGYDSAAPLARARGLDLACGIEMSVRMAFERGGAKTVHLLAYFLDEPASPNFREWILELQAGRRERNVRLVQKLQSLGVDITLAEVEARGRSLAGRPHFAKILIEKGYAKNTEQVFREFIGETAPGYVERDSPHLAFALQQVIAGGGIPVAAHPIRLGFRKHEEEEAAIAEMRDAGLEGLEVFHSDHSAQDSTRYLALAKKYGLAITGGSDFHGSAKPHVNLGSGMNGNVEVPKRLLDDLRKLRH
jgi:predicted metal-dependent phosphoesterase TrpH